ncbi:MAG: hypothetical protein IKV45_04685 [Firmicutes bacterium]|nr:hypothetical protein [Bacillota bacterium]
MTEYLTICQNRICYDLGTLVTADLVEDSWGEKCLMTDLVALPIPLWNSVSLRVFDGFMIKAAETSENECILKTAEFAVLCDIDLRAATRQMQIPCNVIAGISIPNQNTRTDFFSVDPVRGGRRMILQEPFLRYSQGTNARGVMPFPAELFKVNMKHTPMAYLYGRTLAYHKFMNLGKTNEDIIRVESICSYFGYDRMNGAFTRRLLEPFIRNMDALSDIFSYEWLDGLPKNYEYFLRSRLKITWHNYPRDLKYVAKRLKKRRV